MKGAGMKDISDILGPEGLLADAHPNYEHRPKQVEMAQAVEDALEKRRPLICEAATGTGKTLAYLIPALRSGQRVVISTGTKALQDQLFNKDLPFLERHWPEDFEATLLKGRSNYLCKMRFDEFVNGPKSLSHGDEEDFERIKRWARQTETGDRAEIDGLPDDSALWHELSVGSDSCLHTECPHYEECYVTQVREEAHHADIIVVNHHLFFADLSLKDRGVGEILPEYDAVIFDEAHHLESVATSFFGVHVSNYRVTDLLSDIRLALTEEDVVDSAIEEAMDRVDDTLSEFFSLVSFGLGDGRWNMERALESGDNEDIDTATAEFVEALRDLAAALGGSAELGERGERLQGRTAELKSNLQLVTARDDDRYAYFVDIRGRGTFMHAAPIDLANLFRHKLLETHDSMVFTSATLATGGNLDFFKRRLGFAEFAEEGSGAGMSDVDEMILPSVFDYRDQAAIYVPRKMPPPSDDDFTDNVAMVSEYLLDVTDGRAFVLFTSYANLNAVWDKLGDELPFPTYKQGDKPKRELLEQFRADTHSVLFATQSFWEGVDVEGESLSMVIIDKLPFANPSDPLTRARMELIEGRGGNSFASLSLPSAALSLKQGFGRLIRSRSDQGIVAILDSRIAHKSYGRYFLESLPEAPVYWKATDVKAWWHHHVEAVE
jgi:ATP-dependent DNA helicase DinG